MKKIVIRIIYSVALLYLFMLPTLGYLSQGVQEETIDFSDDFIGEVLENLAWIVDFALGFYLILLHALKLKTPDNIKNALILLAGLPVLSIIYIIIFGGDLGFFFYHGFILESSGLVLYLLISPLTRRKVSGKKKFTMYVTAGLIGAIVLFFGIYLNLDVSYFFDTFSTKLDLVFLAIMSIISFIYYFKAFPNPDAQPQTKEIDFPFFKDKVATAIFVLAMITWLGKNFILQII